MKKIWDEDDEEKRRKWDEEVIMMIHYIGRGRRRLNGLGLLENRWYKDEEERSKRWKEKEMKMKWWRKDECWEGGGDVPVWMKRRDEDKSEEYESNDRRGGLEGLRLKEKMTGMWREIENKKMNKSRDKTREEDEGKGWKFDHICTLDQSCA